VIGGGGQQLTFDVLASTAQPEAAFTRLGETASSVAGNVGDLSDRLTRLGRQSETARVALDGDKKVGHELDVIDAKLIRLGRIAANPKTSLEGAAKMRAEISGIDLALDRLGRKTEEPGIGGRGGIFGMLQGGIFSGASALEGLPSIASVAAPGIAAVGAAALLATPAIVGAGIAMASFGGFALLAVPEITKINTAVAKGGKTWKDLTPAEKQVGLGIKGLRGEFHQLQAVIQPYVVTGFAEGLKAVRGLMPALKPLMEAAGKAADKFLGNIAAWISGPSGKKFLHWLEVTGPKDIATFGKAMWDLAQVAGRTFRWMYSEGQTGIRHIKTVLHDGAVAVDWLRQAWVRFGHDQEVAWDNTVIRTEHGITATVGWFRKLPGEVLHTLSGFGHDLGTLGSAAMTAMWHGIMSVAAHVTNWFSGFAHGVVGIFRKIWGWFSPASVMFAAGRDLMLGLRGATRTWRRPPRPGQAPPSPGTSPAGSPRH
jgi:hypothetical protein